MCQCFWCLRTFSFLIWCYFKFGHLSLVVWRFGTWGFIDFFTVKRHKLFHFIPRIYLSPQNRSYLVILYCYTSSLEFSIHCLVHFYKGIFYLLVTWNSTLKQRVQLELGGMLSSSADMIPHINASKFRCSRQVSSFWSILFAPYQFNFTLIHISSCSSVS